MNDRTALFGGPTLAVAIVLELVVLNILRVKLGKKTKA